MRKGWTAFLVGAFFVTMMMHPGVARAFKCTDVTTVNQYINSTGPGCEVVATGEPETGTCVDGTQLTGGGCSSDPAFTLLSSEPVESVDKVRIWSCTYQLPTVDGVCQGSNLSYTITITSICCK